MTVEVGGTGLVAGFEKLKKDIDSKARSRADRRREIKLQQNLPPLDVKVNSQAFRDGWSNIWAKICPWCSEKSAVSMFGKGDLFYCDHCLKYSRESGDTLQKADSPEAEGAAEDGSAVHSASGDPRRP